MTLLIKHGTVVTMNPEREVIPDGAVAIQGEEIVDVGPTSRLEDTYDGTECLDATDSAVLPGFINTHTHVEDIFARGLGSDRRLWDWLVNIKIPTGAVMTADERRLAAALYVTEALRGGMTTFVENASSPAAEPAAAKLSVYRDAGLRNIYAAGFTTQVFEGQRKAIDTLRETEIPEASPKQDTGYVEHIDQIEQLIETYHGTAEGRQSVWPAPISSRNVSHEALQAAVDLAARYDVMTTTHAAETTLQNEGYISSVEYLNAAGYLGDRTLLGHCVHADRDDIRQLAATDTRVAHNPLTNLYLGSGIAPVPELLDAGVTVGLGTDNPSANDSINMLTDIRIAALLHKGATGDAGAITAERAIEMATIDAARGIGRGGDLGSLEPGKKADLVLLDLDAPHMRPLPNIQTAVAYRARGHEIETVICNGSVVLENQSVRGLDAYGDLLHRVDTAAEAIYERAGLEKLADRPWTSTSNRP